MRCAIARIRRTSPSPRRSTWWRASSRGRPTSRTSATTCRTRRPTQSLPAGVELAYDGLPFDHRGRAAFPSAKLRGTVDVIHFPDDPRPGHVAIAGAGARQLRRPASRPRQDHRAHPARRRRARRHERGADVRSAPAPHPSPRQGAGAADDEGAEARRAGARRRPGRRGRPLHARDVAVGAGARSSAACWSSGCASPRCGSAPISCSAAIAAATSRCCKSLGAQYGFRAEKIDPIRYKDFVVSSTRIRRLVSEGRVDEAGALLGHHYAIDGTVVEGAKRGPGDRAFRPPTCRPTNELIPPHGVYATAITIDGRVSIRA